MSDLTSVPNIGPATARALIGAGIPDAATLRRLGAHEAYRTLINAGERPHFIGYYVLHMGLQGRPWNDCAFRGIWAVISRDLGHAFHGISGSHFAPSGRLANGCY